MRSKTFVTTMLTVTGYKSVLFVNDGLELTGLAGYPTQDEAELEARRWAESEDIPYVPGEPEAPAAPRDRSR